MRTVNGRTDRVVVVGAGLGGLACALHLAGSGRQVTVVEREPVPGGRAGRLAVDGYEFDTGPTVLTMPDLIAEALGAVGEELDDWLDLVPVDPAYRAYYPDGSTLDVITDTTRMAAEIARVCGPREADGYLRFVDYARNLWHWERTDFIDRNLDAPTDLLTANLVKLLANGAFRRLQTKINQFFRTRVPSASSPSRRCTRASRRTTRWPSTASSRTSTRWPGSTSRAAASTRSPGAWPAPPRSTACSSGTAPR